MQVWGDRLPPQGGWCLYDTLGRGRACQYLSSGQVCGCTSCSSSDNRGSVFWDQYFGISVVLMADSTSYLLLQLFNTLLHLETTAKQQTRRPHPLGEAKTWPMTLLLCMWTVHNYKGRIQCAPPQNSLNSSGIHTASSGVGRWKLLGGPNLMSMIMS